MQSCSAIPADIVNASICDRSMASATGRSHCQLVLSQATKAGPYIAGPGVLWAAIPYLCHRLLFADKQVRLDLLVCRIGTRYRLFHARLGSISSTPQEV